MKRKSKAKITEVRELVYEAAMACQDKKAEDITLLELDKHAGAFTDYFVICSGSNPRQIQAIFDSVEERLARKGVRPMFNEGYRQAEWAILDYFDFVVHILSEKARSFRGLERLWKSARRLEFEELKPAPVRMKKAAPKKPAPKKAAVRKPRLRKKTPSTS